MADENVLKVGAEFDVAPLIAGTQQAGAAFDSLGAKLKQVAAEAEASGQTVVAQAARFMASGLTVKETASALQNFGISAKEASAAAETAAVAIGEMGDAAAATAPKLETAAIATTGLDRQVANITGRAAGATLGMGFLGGAIGRLAASVPGLGLAFELALPVALLAAFIPKIEELIHKEEQVADAEHAVAEAAQKQNDEIMKLNEEYTKLTVGPLAAYEQELSNIPLLSLNLTNETKTLTKALEEESSWWTIVRAKMEDFFAASSNAKITAYSSDDAEKAITAINVKVLQNKDVSAAINGIEQEITKAAQAQNAEMQEGRYLDAQRTELAMRSLEAEKEYLIAQKEIIADQTKNKAADIAKEELDNTLKRIQAEERVQESIAKTAAINQEELTGQKLIAAEGMPQFSVDQVEARRVAINAALEQELTDKVNAAYASLKIQNDELDQEAELYKKQPEKYEEVVRKQREIAAANSAEVVNIYKTQDEKIAENNREAATKRRDILDKEIGDEIEAAKRMAELQVTEARNAQEQITADEKHQAEVRTAQEKASLSGLSAGPITEALKDIFNDEQLKNYNAELERMREEFGAVLITVAPLKAILASGGILTPEQIETMRAGEEVMKQIQATMGQIQIKQIELKSTMLSSWQEIERAMQNAMQRGADTFNQQFIKMIYTGQSFARTMINVWNSMAENFINAVLKMVEQWIAAEILKLAATQTANQTATASSLAENAIQRLDSAKTAAAKAMASVGFPLDLVVGPLVFAAALAFKEGGLVPGSASTAMPIIAHGQEMVLPAPISTALQGAIPAINTFNASVPSGGLSAGGNRIINNRVAIHINHQGSNMSHEDMVKAVKMGIRKGQIGAARF